MAATFALYAGIALIATWSTSRRALRIVTWAAAAMLTGGVGLARIYRGDHHPSDVIAGLLLGAGALCVAALAARTQVTRPGRPGGRLARRADR